MQIYNSLTGKKEAFVPLEPGKVRLYVCGMTVYDYCHIGHARVMVAFDVVVRYFRYKGYQVTYVRNITDIDDKIIRRAQETQQSLQALTDYFIQAMHEDAQALGVLTPDLEPRATQTMDAIQAMIQRLLDNGFAYCADNGDVYYDVSRFASYGKLANKRLEDLRVGARVDIDDTKADPLDFVLWKAAKPDEPSWPSPWGAGRPGWHIECSAMSTLHLGNHFDIHGGGMDLKFPHHENEIAQSEAAHEQTYVNYWMHNGFVQINDEKMSKSLGNFFTVRDVLERYQPEVVRFFIIASHYRSPLHYSDDNLEHAKASLARLYTALRGLPANNAAIDDAYKTRFQAAMDDDFNTPEALSILFDLARETNRLRNLQPESATHLANNLHQLGAVLGLLQDDPETFLQGHPQEMGEGLSAADIESLITQRNAARNAKNWAEADRIRAQLAAADIVLEDGANGTIWRRN